MVLLFLLVVLLPPAFISRLSVTAQIEDLLLYEINLDGSLVHRSFTLLSLPLATISINAGAGLMIADVFVLLSCHAQQKSKDAK